MISVWKFDVQNCCLVLFSESSAGKDVDDAEVLAILHSLYSITFTPQGRDAVVTVFTLDENIGVLLPFVELTGIYLSFVDNYYLIMCEKYNLVNKHILLC